MSRCSTRNCSSRSTRASPPQDVGFAKKGGAPVAALEVKVDTYVLETDVHFPTDLNLLWDAGRKCVDLVEGLLSSGHGLPGLAQVQGLAASTQGLRTHGQPHRLSRRAQQGSARESGGA